MADKTRQDVVEENLEDLIDRYGEDSYELIKIQLLKDIDISLAMLVDGKA